MEAAHMSFAEEVIRLRSEGKQLRQENGRVKRSNESLTRSVLRLEKENQVLKRDNQILKKEQRMLIIKQQEQEKALESLRLIIEELRRMVFGKKKTSEDTGGTSESNKTESTTPDEKKKRKPADRQASSYRRPVPADAMVTDTHEHPLTHCPDCGTLLLRLKEVIRYVEDLFALAALPKLLKKIEKHIILTGYCPTCHKRKSAKEISPQVSTLGENVREFIAYQIIIMQLSFEQVKSLLIDMAGLHISDGEISVSLDEQAGRLTPERDRVMQRIRGAPGSHYDETGWRTIGGAGDYCWIKRSTTGTDAVFLMGRSRGKGNAEELKGAEDGQVGISDDYGAYQNLFGKHQLCVAHPHRKLRDLHESKTLSETSRTVCSQSYAAFSTLYADLEKTLASVYQKEVWLQKREEYLTRIKEIALPTGNDPQKLKAIKDGLLRNAEKYFTCLLQPGIPCDNNKAERGLRHVVLKRKSSYGSKSQKGANTMAVLCTALLSKWWSKPDNFFAAYEQMLTA